MTKLATEAETTLSSFYEKMRGESAPHLRAAAWDTYARKGLPNRRVEEWRYTDLKAALREVSPLAAGDGAPLRLAEDRLRLPLVGGAFAADPSVLAGAAEGVTISSLREELTAGDPQFLAAAAQPCDDAAAALNAALMQDGIVLRVAPGARVERPIELVNLSGAASAFTRNVVIVGEGARATIVEAAQPLVAGALENHALALAIGAGASVELVSDISFGQPGSIRVHTLLATLSERGALRSYGLIRGGGLVRRQIFARLAGAQCEATFNGATLLKDRDHADATLVVEHAAPGGKSRERFRTIVDGAATGVFQGKVIVRPGAQKTDGAMQSKALLLSDGATMNYKPELEIYADDVQCGHGATCGRLDAEQLFYLESRGVPPGEAETLLIEGFVNEAFEGLFDEVLRAELSERVNAWLGVRGVSR